MADQPIQHAETVAVDTYMLAYVREHVLADRYRALLEEVLTTEHVWYGEPEEGHASDCPGCDLERRIREALNDGDGNG